MRHLIETHLNHCSVNTVESSFKICEKNIYKGDIFSFGCIVYEMMFLKIAFDNNFVLADEAFFEVYQRIKQSKFYSGDLKNLTLLSLTKNPEDRPNINQIFEKDFMVERVSKDFSQSYKKQVFYFV